MSPPIPIDVDLRLRVGRAWREIRRGAAAIRIKDVFYGVGPEALDMALADALAVLCASGPMRMGELAANLRITPASTTRAVNCLVAMGYADRVKAADDQRSVVVSATPEGHERFGVFSDRIQTGLQEILSEFDADEQVQLADLLERFAASVDRFVQDQSNNDY